MKYRIFSVLMVLAMVASLCVMTAAPVSASATATRDLPDSVLPNTQFNVTVNVAGAGAMGQINETLPAGFTYVSINDPQDYNVTVTGQNVKITFIGGAANITYQVLAPAQEATYAFIGTTQGDDLQQSAITGDTSMDVAIPPACTPGLYVDNVDLSNNKAGANDVRCRITVRECENGIAAGEILTFTFSDAFDLSNLDKSLNTTGAAIDTYKYFKWRGNAIDASDLTFAGNSITLFVPAALGANTQGTLEIYSQAGLGNPNISQEVNGVGICDDKASGNLYTVKAKTAALTGTFNVPITDYFKVSGTNFASGAATQVTCYGFSPNATVHISGGLQGSGVVGSDGVVEVTAVVTGSQTDIKAQDTTGRVACDAWGNYNLLPTLEVMPLNGTICSPIVITGKNYDVMPNQITMGGVPIPGAFPTAMDLDGDGDWDDFRVTGVFVPRSLQGGIYTVNAGAGAASYTVNGKTVSVAPSAGPPGTTVTINGTGWCPLDKDPMINIKGKARLLYGNGAEGVDFITNISVDDQGNFSATGQIPDDFTADLHGVVVYFDPDGTFPDMDGDGISSQGMFTVTARDLIINPNSGIAMGNTVALSGGDFGRDAKGEQPMLYVNYQFQGLNEVDLDVLTSSGDIVPITFELSRNLNFHYGENTVEIRANVNGKEMSASTTIDILRPTFEITPTNGSRGTQITGTGKYWPAGEANFVTIAYNCPDLGKSDNIDIVRPNASGEIWTQFDVPAFKMPANANGLTMLITANDGAGPESNESEQSVFRVNVPSITVTPDEAAPGETITIAGIGFQPKSMVQEVSIGDAPIVKIYDLPLTDGKGAFTVVGTVPGVMEGGHLVKVRVTQNQGDEITASFNVKAGETGTLTVGEVFATVIDKIVKIWTFEEDGQDWLVWDNSAADAPKQFTTMAPGQGYWVEVSEDCNWAQGVNAQNLKAPWNLIGFVG